jgi:hypothetical protein
MNIAQINISETNSKSKYPKLKASGWVFVFLQTGDIITYFWGKIKEKRFWILDAEFSILPLCMTLFTCQRTLQEPASILTPKTR